MATNTERTRNEYLEVRTTTEAHALIDRAVAAVGLTDGRRLMGAQSAFGTVALTPVDWLWIVAVAAPVFAIGEFTRMMRSRRPLGQR